MHLYFDLDGTLYQTKYAVIHAVKTLFSELDVPAPADQQIITCIGKTTHQFLKALLPRNVKPDGVRERFSELDRRAVREYGFLFSGVPELLEQLQAAGHRLSVCSNGSVQYIDLVLEHTGIGLYFDNRFSAKHSPSKAEFLKSVLKPGEPSVFIGDKDVISMPQSSLSAVCCCFIGYGDPEQLRRRLFGNCTI
jgi:phosphoglycolate phosphatase